MQRFSFRKLLTGALIACATLVGTSASVFAAEEFTPSTLSSVDINQYTDISIRLNRTGHSTWVLHEGTLPPGLSLGATEQYSEYSIKHLIGTPTAAGDYSFTLGAYTVGGFYQKAYSLRIINPAIIINPPSIVTGQVGVAYSQPLSPLTDPATSASDYLWLVVAGQLPPGLSLNISTGVISGTPTTAGSYSFSVHAQGDGRTATRSYTTTIAAATPSAPLALQSTTNPVSGTVGAVYSAQIFPAQGGTSPYTWSATGVPAGLALNANTGILSGTPTVAGTYSMNLTVGDAVGASVSHTYTVVINPAPTSSSSPLSSPTTTPTSTPTAPSAPVTPTPTSSTPPSSTGSSSTPTAPTTPSSSSSPSSSTDSDAAGRIEILARLGVDVNALVKLPDDGNIATQEDSAVYYIGRDGRRHAFPNSRVYASWYQDFSQVRVVTLDTLSRIPLGANITYRPGVTMVKFTTDNKVYLHVGNRHLRWIASEAAARDLFGPDWNRRIDDISDVFYTDYIIDTDTGITGQAEVNTKELQFRFLTPSDSM